ncbi:hypothetical protein VTK73DRAFT_4859 [Phialemonium thermophilum]|uniref:Uncharacterized protein n=1 Tax=Phialemonium thermophilum TaxID=223376 RepID=A0ABR3WRF9_9PEZI
MRSFSGFIRCHEHSGLTKRRCSKTVYGMAALLMGQKPPTIESCHRLDQAKTGWECHQRTGHCPATVITTFPLESLCATLSNAFTKSPNGNTLSTGGAHLPSSTSRAITARSSPLGSTRNHLLSASFLSAWSAGRTASGSPATLSRTPPSRTAAQHPASVSPPTQSSTMSHSCCLPAAAQSAIEVLV